MHRAAFMLVLVFLVALAACSPALNWRELQLDDGKLKAVLPCKPDAATRPQRLGGETVQIAMTGCEAGGAFFAVSAADLPPGGHGVALAVHWRAQMLANVQAQPSVSSTAAAVRGADAAPAPLLIQAQGEGPDKQPVQVQALWFARAGRLYHAAVYAPRLAADMTEPFFGGLELK